MRSVPVTLVSMNASGPRIERSTWLSAAKWATTSMSSLSSRLLDQRPIEDRAFDETEARIAMRRGEIGEVARIGQGVENDDALGSARQQVSDEDSIR